jgi:hypothetical protein
VETLIPLSQSAPLLDRVDDALVSGEIAAHISIGHLIVLIIIFSHVVVLGSGGRRQKRNFSFLLSPASKNILR